MNQRNLLVVLIVLFLPFLSIHSIQAAGKQPQKKSEESQSQNVLTVTKGSVTVTTPPPNSETFTVKKGDPVPPIPAGSTIELSRYSKAIITPATGFVTVKAGPQTKTVRAGQVATSNTGYFTGFIYIKTISVADSSKKKSEVERFEQSPFRP